MLKLNFDPTTSRHAIARALLLSVKEHEATLEKLEAAREDRAAIEQAHEKVAEVLGVKPDAEDAPSLHVLVREVLEERAELRARVDRAGDASKPWTVVERLASLRRSRLVRLSNELTSLVAHFEGSAAHEQLCKSIKRLAKEALEEEATS